MRTYSLHGNTYVEIRAIKAYAVSRLEHEKMTGANPTGIAILLTLIAKLNICNLFANSQFPSSYLV